MIISEKNKEALSALLLGLVAVIVATLVISGIRSIGLTSGGGKITKDQVDRIEENVNKITETVTPYQYKNKISSIKIVENFSNTTKNNEPPENLFQRNLKVTGKIKSGFLYVKTSVNRKALTPDDDVYIKMMGNIDGKYTELGGHLIESKSLEVPKSDQYTEMLFNLSDVKYKKSYKDPNYQVLSGDWLDLLNRGNSKVLLSFVSTERMGVLENISIYFECESAECSIE